MTERRSLLGAVRSLAVEAGAVALAFHGPGAAVAVESKTDGSPVTEADRAAEAVILEGLARLTPEIPAISEEAAAAGNLPRIGSGSFWLVDPLDGTREFIAGNREFTVNIALIEDGHPVLGVVHAPALAVTYAGLVPGFATVSDPEGGERRIAARQPDALGLIVVASRRHDDPEALRAYLEGRPVKGLRRVGSSLKFGLVAAGEADLYPRFGPTMEWDTAAGHAVLRAAGGTVRTMNGSTLLYGKPGFLNPAFVGAADITFALHADLTARMKAAPET